MSDREQLAHSEREGKETDRTLSPAALKASPVAALCSGENLAGTAITALLTFREREKDRKSTRLNSSHRR